MTVRHKERDYTKAKWQARGYLCRRDGRGASKDGGTLDFAWTVTQWPMMATIGRKRWNDCSDDSPKIALGGVEVRLGCFAHEWLGTVLWRGACCSLSLSFLSVGSMIFLLRKNSTIYGRESLLLLIREIAQEIEKEFNYTTGEPQTQEVLPVVLESVFSPTNRNLLAKTPNKPKPTKINLNVQTICLQVDFT